MLREAERSTSVTRLKLQRIQNRSMDILGLERNTLEPLDVRRDNHTVKAFNEILDLKDHPCWRFINESTHSYRLRSQQDILH